MSVAQDAAGRLLTEYCRSQGRETPAVEAARLLSRIRVCKARWANRDTASSALRLLGNAAIDVDDLAENHLGVTLSVECLERFDRYSGAPVYGVARPNSRHVTVCTRALKYEPLYRATIAHELGHTVLHQRDSGLHAYSPQSPHRPSIESEADEFMTAILLPDPVFHLSLAFVAHFHRIDIREIGSRADSNRGREQWRRYLLPFCVNSLCVSRHLVCVWALKRGFVNRETLAYHLTYAMPNRWLDPSSSYSRSACEWQVDWNESVRRISKPGLMEA